MMPAKLVVLVVAAVAGCLADAATVTRLALPRAVRVGRSSMRMLAADESKGFGDRPKPKQRSEQPAVDEPSAAAPPASEPKRKQPDADSVLARVGIKSDRPADVPLPNPEAAPPPEPQFSLLAGVPMETQNSIEQVLFVVAGLALTSFIFIGFAVVFDSYAIVMKMELSEGIQAVLDFITPLFTPALGVVLSCSISLGLFKQAQLNEADIAYKEDD